MLYNRKMGKLLRKIDKKALSVTNQHLIEKRQTTDREDYYCVNHDFCFPYDEKISLKGKSFSECSVLQSERE